MTRVLIGLMLAMTASGAMASNWIPIPHLPHGPDMAAYDQETFTRTGHVVEFWEKSTWNNVHMMQNVQFNTVQSQWQIDCDQHTYGFRARSFYLANGQQTGQDGDNYYHPAPISPDSWMQTLERAVCR